MRDRAWWLDEMRRYELAKQGVTAPEIEQKFFFSEASEANIATLDPFAQEVIRYAMSLQIIDFAVIKGWRGEVEQNEAYKSGKSTLKWPQSKHNVISRENGKEKPSATAWDSLPFSNGKPVSWKDTHAFCILAGVFMTSAAILGGRVKSGADWDGDGDTTDQKFMDFGHTEVVKSPQE